MGCHNTKSSKTSPDFYYQTSFLSKSYTELAQKLQQSREKIYEAIEKAYLLQDKEISHIQDVQTIQETINQFQQSKETQEYYIIEAEYIQFKQAQKSIQLELSDVVEHHRVLLKKICSKQPPSIEKMLSKMQSHRDMLLGYYRMLFSQKTIDEKSTFQHQYSFKAYSTREEM